MEVYLIININLKTKIMLTNTSWKTTLLGILLAIVVVVAPLLQTGTVTWKDITIAVLLAIAGYLQKDKDVTGGTRTNNEKVVK
jgi:hypothetical protein